MRQARKDPTVYYVAAGLLLAMLALGLGLGLGISNRIESLKRETEMLKSSLVSTRMALDESIMDLAMNATAMQDYVIEQGVFDVTLTQIVTFPNTWPVQTSTNVPFTLKQVLIGPLNFTMLILDSPSPMLTSPFLGSSTRISMFVPTGISFNLNNAAGFVAAPFPYIPISPANLARLNMPCLALGGCRVAPDPTLTLPDTEFFFNSFQIESLASDNGLRLNFMIIPNTAADMNWNFTWSEPLQLILPLL